MVAMKLLVPPVLREYAGGAELDVAGGTVGEVLAALDDDLRCRVLDERGELFPYLRLFVNDEEANRLLDRARREPWQL